MMHTKRIFVSARRHRVLAGYLSGICGKSRALRNVTNFYIRNMRSALSKSPEERSHNEVEVMHDVFTGLQRANRRRREAFSEKLAGAPGTGRTGLKLHAYVYGLLRKARPFAYPEPGRWFPSYEVLDAVFKETGNPAYFALPAQVNQQAVRSVVESWKSYFKSLKAYGKDLSGYRAKPKAPGYIKGAEATAKLTNQVARLKDIDGRHVLSFPLSRETLVIGHVDGRYVKTEVVPCFGGYAVLITAEDGLLEVPVPDKASRFFGVDVGVNNLAAVANNVGAAPFIIRGRAVKAVNQWFNKRKAELISAMTKGKDPTRSRKESRALDALSRRRSDFLRDFFYKAAHYICRQAVKDGIQVIIAGHNTGQKDEISLGHGNNQDFVCIPYTQFLRTLKHTAWKYGIAYVEREESYTSKASLLDMDDIPNCVKSGSKKHFFSGRRVRRGLYRSGGSILINADVNGAGNIIRKEYPDAFKGLEDLSSLYRTTNVVGFKDLYEPGDPKEAMAKRKASKHRRHKPGPCSAANRKARWDEKVRLMEGFNAGKKKYIPAAKEKAAA